MNCPLTNVTLDLALAFDGTLLERMEDACKSVSISKACWSIICNALMASGCSANHPVKWTLDGSNQALLHSNMALDTIPWWFNWANNSRLPLSPLLIIAATIFKHAKGTAAEAGRLHTLGNLLTMLGPVDLAWSTGSGSHLAIEDLLYKAFYICSRGANMANLKDNILSLPTPTFVQPQDFQLISVINNVKTFNLAVSNHEYRMLGNQIFQTLHSPPLRCGRLLCKANTPGNLALLLVPLVENVFLLLEH